MKYAAKIKKGVLQGGILSPLLFTLYINDLAEELEKQGLIFPYFYADDLAVLVCGKVNMKKTIKIIENWCKKNYITLNYKKCGKM